MTELVVGTPKVEYHPNDHYDDRLLQAVALKGMGYPVQLEPVTADSLHDLYVSDTYFHDRLRRYDRWFKETLVSPFWNYVEFPDVTGDVFHSDAPELDDLISNHPISLTYDVDSGDVGGLAHYLKEFSEHGECQYLKHADRNFPWKGVLSRCIVAAYGRAELDFQFDWTPDDMTWHTERAEHDLTDHADLVAALKRSGVRPINPEQLTGLVVDYYRLIEANFPDFVAFKDTTDPRSAVV